VREETAMIELSYLSLEGTPGLVVKDHDRKEMTVYEYVGGGWRQPSDNGAKMMRSGAEGTREQFERQWPDIGLPEGVKAD
jgi:hypothetical protein